MDMQRRHPDIGMLAALVLGLVVGFSSLFAAERTGDWPNWRGPHHDGVSRETGLLDQWPTNGPKVVWQRPLPGGYSSVAVSRSRLITPSKEGNEEIVSCLDAVTGKQLWEYRYPC